MPSQVASVNSMPGPARRACFLLICAMLAGCSTLGSSGPSTQAVKHAARAAPEGADQIKIVTLDAAAARRVINAGSSRLLSEMLGDGVPFGAVVGKGDVLDISVWEAPPAALFGVAPIDSRLSIGASGATSKGTGLPEQMVGTDGQVTLPFVGRLTVAGRTPAQIERDIAARLHGIAHDPQVVVRVSRNATSDVTIVGDVVNSARVPLTPKGERLLDIIASAGGVRQPVGKTTIQVSRSGTIAALPLEKIISDPGQNIRMQADDVVTALYQPYSFTALGAVGNNAEVAFEATGITLAQALGRIGGLRDDRANAKGLFIFRLEDPAALDPAMLSNVRTTPSGKIPVIYQIDLKNPASFFVAQDFPIHNRDLIYVSNAPAADLQKLVTIVSSRAFSIIGISNSL